MHVVRWHTHAMPRKNLWALMSTCGLLGGNIVRLSWLLLLLIQHLAVFFFDVIVCTEFRKLALQDHGLRINLGLRITLLHRLHAHHLGIRLISLIDGRNSH